MEKKPHSEIVEVTLPSSTRHLHAMRMLTSTLAESMGFGHKASESTALAVEEALTNVMEHSYHGDTSRRMQVIFEMQGEKFTIRILHNGDQIEIGKLSRKDELADYLAQKKKGGLGILIMKRCMDEVTYKAGSPQNECCMIKYLPKNGDD
ncbi:MAG TPA: ATP-binding protein [Acidobacteriota bacterium]|nr:ATP-binding protein [Acidobacteriota bacterium]